jgi:hypothetical protein
MFAGFFDRRFVLKFRRQERPSAAATYCSTINL